jgi:hypothetical protein
MEPPVYTSSTQSRQVTQQATTMSEVDTTAEQLLAIQQFSHGDPQHLTTTERISCLSAFFEPNDLEWRPMTIKRDKTACKPAAYISNRAIQNSLDLYIGPENWQNVFTTGPDGGVLCGIGIKSSSGEWIWKYDGAENTNIESVKGGISNAMKRAGYQWHIGRYLYELPDVGWIPLENERYMKYTPTLEDRDFLPPKRESVAELATLAFSSYETSEGAIEQLRALCYTITNRRTTVPMALSANQCDRLIAGLKKKLGI